MRAIIASLSILIALGTGIEGAQAKARKKAAKAKKGAPLKATEQTKLGIEKLMGVFKWGMPPQKVFAVLEKDIHAEFEPQVKATQDPMIQDRIRKEKNEKIKELKNNYVKFHGKQTSWDISMVDKEFAHKNNESMAVVWTKKDRRFFFFHNEKLYKLYIAFNADLYQDKTFEDFAQVMEARFGKAERKFTTTIKGDQVMDHLAWPPSGNTLLRAIDNTKLYSNFCLVLAEKSEVENVNSGRKMNSPKKEYSDPLVDQVVKGGGSGGDSEEDIVDRITGKGSRAPSVSDTGTGASPPPSARRPGSGRPEAAPAAKPKKGKKVDPKNPLDGLDI
jgi:hypothetical protein